MSDGRCGGRELGNVLLSVCFLFTFKMFPKLKKKKMKKETDINVTETSSMNPSLS